MTLKEMLDQLNRSDKSDLNRQVFIADEEGYITLFEWDMLKLQRIVYLEDLIEANHD